MTDLLRPAEASGTPAEGPPRSRRSLWWAVAGGSALFALAIWLVIAKLPRWLSAPINAPTTAAAPSTASARKIQATLFYVSDDGLQLVAMTREVLYGATPGEQARQLVEAQVQAPPEGSASAIPPGSTVRSVFLTPTGQAYVDLGGAIVSAHSGGTLDEALTVYAVVDVLTVNMPDITSVQILVNGKQVDTLAGHVDLRYPLAKSLDWVRKGS